MGFEHEHMYLGGYFPKRVAMRPDWLRAAAVEEICSVSACISPGPDDWVQRWLHNDLGWFDTPELAARTVPEDGGGYRLFAYRVLPTRYRDGAAERWPVMVSPVGLDGSYRSLGFDAVSKSRDDSLGFECSPLSCNGLAKELTVNKHCLFETLDEAMNGARQFSIDGAEPGVYYVVEVLERVPDGS